MSARLSFFIAAVSFAASAFAADPLPTATPKSVGMSAERLARIGEVLQADIDKGRLPGAVIAVARRGKLVYFQAFGYLDKDAGTKMTTDAIFSIASMTKPMVAVGALKLDERGLVQIDDPVSKYLPQFGKQQVAVLKADDGGQATTWSRPSRQPTIMDLMRHTSGIIYGGRGATPVHKLYPAGSGARWVRNDGPGVHRQARRPAAAPPARRGLGLRLRPRRARRGDRESLRAGARPVPRRAAVEAARHGGHGLRRAGGQAEALRQGLRQRPGDRQAAVRARSVQAAQVRVRRRLRRFHRGATTCASRRCC